MTQDKIVTRFPPSPTGYLHIGGARTALYNWLFARQKKGKFILRIEDTDKERSTEEATRAIVESLHWLGLDWDEGPYLQSERYAIYWEFVDRLLTSGKAYYCHCTPEELDRRRQEAMAKGLKPKYDGRCRERGLGPALQAVVRLKSPQSGKTRFHDLIKGPISFNNEELDDLILWRSDGSPTYHLAVVADDIAMGMTHIIRGDDHVNNTPRQMLIYEALGEPLPFYAHVPMILGPDRTRLSKRHGATSVLAYRDMGYLPQALINALVRVGWSYGDQEKFSLAELVEKFGLESVGKSAGIFNSEKLLDLNAVYIRETPARDLARDLTPFLERAGCHALDQEKLLASVETLKPRSKTLLEMAENGRFYFVEDVVYDPAGAKKFLTPEAAGLIKDMLQRLDGAADFSRESLEKIFFEFTQEKEIPLGVIAQPLRVALTGRAVSPGLFEVMEVLGRKRVLQRVQRAIGYVAAPGGSTNMKSSSS